MSPPLYTPDGTEVSEVVLPNGETAVEVIAPDGDVVFSAIPDSVASRPDDNSTLADNDLTNGVRFETDVEWGKIGGEISNNTVGATKAYVYRVSDAALLGSTASTSFSPGDTFTIDLSENLVSGEEYNFVVDAEGGNYDRGIYDSVTFPYESSDGNLRITEGAVGADSFSGTNAYNIKRIGDVGFD